MRVRTILIVAGLGCVLFTSSTCNGETIYACKKKIGGTIHIVSAKTVWLPPETKMSWDGEGPQGLPGSHSAHLAVVSGTICGASERRLVSSLGNAEQLEDLPLQVPHSAESGSDFGAISWGASARHVGTPRALSRSKSCTWSSVSSRSNTVSCWPSARIVPRSVELKMRKTMPRSGLSVDLRISPSMKTC